MHLLLPAHRSHLTSGKERRLMGKVSLSQSEAAAWTSQK